MSKKEQLQNLLAWIDGKQKEYKGKEMPQSVGEEIDAKADEAYALQADIQKEEAREQKLAGAREFAGRMTTTTVPEDGQPTQGRKSTVRDVAGYISRGLLVTASPAFRAFIEGGKSKAGMAVDVPTFLRKVDQMKMVPLTARQVDELKAVPTIGGTIGDNIIEPTRLPEIDRSVEQDRLTLRDVLDIGTTVSNAVKYIRSTYTRGATTVAQGAVKPQAGLAFEALSALVRKIAVWIPVDDEQLDDFQELSRVIDTELLYDLAKRVEELVMYGDGVGQNWTGILNDPDVPSARVETDDTIIDTVRRAITDVRIAGYDPNAAVMHPLDWEDAVLAKGTDKHYIHLVVSDGTTMRLHGVNVIETVATEAYEGDLVEARHMVVGDFRRGATLWDRQQANVQVGWQDDQFIRNQRTILAELRAAFAVRRPLAFVKHETQAADVS